MSELTTPAATDEAKALTPPPKTAVIVLHGVADQKRGETVQSMVD